MNEAKHTPGAIRAAEIITGMEYGRLRQYPTSHGPKTTAGIADLIDRETAAPALLAACKAVVREIDATDGATNPCICLWGDVVRAAIAEATGKTAPAYFGAWPED